MSTVSTTQLTTADGHRLGADLAMPDRPVAALRFDFRADHDDGRGERLDLVAALDELAAELPGYRLAAVGYSFGAAVALATRDDRIAALVAIAPPLAMAAALEPPAAPTLVVCPRHDQFSPPETTEPTVATWPAATFEVIESADHFLHGHRSSVAARSTAWLLGRPELTSR